MPPLPVVFLGSPLLLSQAKDFFGLKLHCEFFSDLPPGPFPLKSFPLLPDSALCVTSVFLSPEKIKNCSCMQGRDGWRGQAKPQKLQLSKDYADLLWSCFLFLLWEKIFQSFVFQLSSLSPFSFSFPFPLPLLPLFTLSSLLFPFLPVFRATVLCEEGRSILFADPRWLCTPSMQNQRVSWNPGYLVQEQ